MIFIFVLFSVLELIFGQNVGICGGEEKLYVKYDLCENIDGLEFMLRRSRNPNEPGIENSRICGCDGNDCVDVRINECQQYLNRTKLVVNSVHLTRPARVS